MQYDNDQVQTSQSTMMASSIFFPQNPYCVYYLAVKECWFKVLSYPHYLSDF